MARKMQRFEEATFYDLMDALQQLKAKKNTYLQLQSEREKIAERLESIKQEKTPCQKELNHLEKSLLQIDYSIDLLDEETEEEIVLSLHRRLENNNKDSEVIKNFLLLREKQCSLTSELSTFYLYQSMIQKIYQIASQIDQLLKQKKKFFLFYLWIKHPIISCCHLFHLLSQEISKVKESSLLNASFLYQIEKKIQNWNFNKYNNFNEELRGIEQHLQEVKNLESQLKEKELLFEEELEKIFTSVLNR